jgi:glucokinase-like ROK family protein
MIQTADQIYVRKVNTAIVLETLRKLAPLSRAEISNRTGLNRSTVSSIVQILLDNKLIRETELQEDRVGRPGMSLTLNPLGGFAVGLEINVDYVGGILVDFNGQVRHQLRVDCLPQENRDQILNKVIDLGRVMFEQASQLGVTVFGIGIGLPGVIDIHKGSLVFAPNLGWRDTPIQKIIYDQFNVPVFIENEASCAALGEYRYGVAQEVTDFIYLSGGVGLGGGIMLSGELFRGSLGYAGEIGHTVIYQDGNPCSCGRRGCWETYVGSDVILGKYKISINSETPIHLEFDDLVQAAGRNDPTVMSILRETAVHLGVGVVNLVNIFNPALIVLGGELSCIGEWVIPKISEMIIDQALTGNLEPLPVRASQLGSDACLKGAVSLVLDELIRNPSDWIS